MAEAENLVQAPEPEEESAISAEQVRRILIPVDHSQHAEAAFTWYLDNISHPKDELFIVHCSEIHPPALPHAMATEEWKNYLDDHDQKIKKLEAHYKSLCEQHNVRKTTICIEVGSPGDAICRSAKKHEITMIVMGSRGAGLIRRTVMGSVSDYVLHHAHIPVTVIPKK